LGRPLIRIAIPLLLAIPIAAPAQTSFGIATGMVSAPGQTSNNAGSALVGEGFVERRVNRLFAVRVDLLATHLSMQEGGFTSPGGLAYPVYDDRLTLATLTVGPVLYLTPIRSDTKMYVTLGVGGYRVSQDPDTPGAVTKPQVSVGGGISERMGKRTALFLEARYCALSRAPYVVRQLSGVVLGVRF